MRYISYDQYHFLNGTSKKFNLCTKISRIFVTNLNVNSVRQWLGMNYRANLKSLPPFCRHLT